MSETSGEIAEAAAFRSFANGYPRGIDAGAALRQAQADGPPAPRVEWTLPGQRAILRADTRPASVARHLDPVTALYDPYLVSVSA